MNFINPTNMNADKKERFEAAAMLLSIRRVKRVKKILLNRQVVVKGDDRAAAVAALRKSDQSPRVIEAPRTELFQRGALVAATFSTTQEIAVRANAVFDYMKETMKVNEVITFETLAKETNIRFMGPRNNLRATLDTLAWSQVIKLTEKATVTRITLKSNRTLGQVIFAVQGIRQKMISLEEENKALKEKLASLQNTP